MRLSNLRDWIESTREELAATFEKLNNCLDEVIVLSEEMRQAEWKVIAALNTEPEDDKEKEVNAAYDVLWGIREELSAATERSVRGMEEHMQRCTIAIAELNQMRDAARSSAP